MGSRILVIDDDRLVTKSLGKLLEMSGYAVSIAQSGSEALAALETAKPDLIISDIRMPDMDGIETYEAITRKFSEQGKLAPPVIFITGYPDDPSSQEVSKVSATNLIYKPFDKDKFLEAIAEAIKSDQ